MICRHLSAEFVDQYSIHTANRLLSWGYKSMRERHIFVFIKFYIWHKKGTLNPFFPKLPLVLVFLTIERKLERGGRGEGGVHLLHHKFLC